MSPDQVDGRKEDMNARSVSWHRGAAILVAVGLAFALTGDRARAGLIPGVGIDPFEVLDLQVKPNVIVVLDSSGSMTETVLGTDTTTGDHPRSKMGQAKAVLSQVITANDTKASFLFGQYTSNAVQQGTGRGGDRWYYGTDSAASPSMLTAEVVLNYFAFQQMVAASNTVVFGEEQGLSGSTESICQFTIPPGGYRQGTGAGSMAAALQTGMNAPASCAPARLTPNAYTVGWDAANSRFTFTENAGGNNHRWRMRWGNLAPAATSRVLLTDSQTKGTPAFTNGGVACTQNACSGPVLRISRRDTGMKFNDTVITSPGPPPVTANRTFYTLRSTRFWNGQTLTVLAPPSTVVCDVLPGTGGDGTVANPWFVNVAVVASCGATPGTAVKFEFIGSLFGGNNISCSGFDGKVPLRPCDQTTPPQIDQIGPFLQRQVGMTVGNTAGTCAGTACPVVNYSESTDGQFNQLTAGTPAGIPAAGSTPVIQTILDVDGQKDNISGGPRPQRGFTELWINGQVGPPAVTAISTHPNPKERTILLFITDGDPTCDDPNTGGGTTSNTLALGSAWAAEQAFQRIDPAEPTSSLQTYFVAFGNGASVTRANWIAWGGSGFTSQMVASINGGVGSRGNPSGTTNPAGPAPPGTDNYIEWAIGPTATDKANLCPTCIDAFVAPDGATLEAQLTAILNQGASVGEFSAQQSVTSNVYEYTNLIPGTDPDTGAAFSPATPGIRYAAFVPTRFISTFSIPGFQGQFRAYTDVDADGAVDGPGPNGERWSAGDKLVSLVSTGRDGASGMTACSQSGVPGECTFLELHNNATDANIGSSTARIQRRIYSSSSNGFTGVTADSVVNLTNPTTGMRRVALWPPVPDGVGPNSDTTLGLFDAAFGLPTTTTALDYASLKTTFRACKGIGAGGVPVDSVAVANTHPCKPTNVALSAGRARRESREMILAFLAGAKFVADGAGDPKRLQTGPNAGEIVYAPRGWMLAEGTLSTPAVSSPPIADNPDEEPGRYVDEYRAFRDGLRNPPTPPNQNPGDEIGKGLGLRNPDKDSLAPFSGITPLPDPRTNLKPVMTVVYLGTNSMLHAFRAGPCDPTTCSETGGEELWGWVPFDQLRKLRNRYLTDPQPRQPHDYMIATSLRFGDVFVPTSIPPAPPTQLTISNGAATFSTTNGVWRRLLYVGRGIGGKYWTALDVTAAAMYTETSLTARPPLVYWSRGNPDTLDGTTGGTPVDAADTAAYATMGQTWSVPAINFVDKVTAPGGVDFILNMGSGFSDLPGCQPGVDALGNPTSPPPNCTEGHNIYTVDALTGHMIGSVDVDAAAASIGQGLPRPNSFRGTAIVANVAGFSKARFFPTVAFHPARDFTTRNYAGDVQGRLWKVLVADPNTAVPVADIGEDQPLGSPLGLFGLLGNAGSFTAASQLADIPSLKPTIFGSSGYDNRVPVPPDETIPQFKNFGVFDNGGDTDTTPGTATLGGAGINVFAPNIQFLLGIPFEAGSNFRGSLQPTTAALDKDANQVPDGVAVFFGGTRFNPIGSPFATDPCRSSFDSIIFALDINTGGAAFDTVTGADGFTIFQDSRLVGVFTTYSPDTGTGGKLVLDEGLVKGAVTPPPPAGQPQGTSDTNFIVNQLIQPDTPAPGVRFGSTVCQ
jgi:hypothetical protein